MTRNITPESSQVKSRMTSHPFAERHRRLMNAMNLSVLARFMRLCIGRAGFSSARVISSSLNWAVNAIMRDEAAWKMLDKDDDGNLSTRGVTQIYSCLYSLMYSLRKKNVDTLGLDDSSRIKLNRRRILPKDPVTPGVERPVVSGNLEATMDVKDSGYIGEKSAGAINMAASSSQCKVNGSAVDRLGTLLTDPRVSKKLKNRKEKDLDGVEVEVSCYDQIQWALGSLDKTAGKAKKAVKDLTISMICFFDPNFRIYLLGAITLQSSEYIKALIRLPNPKDLGLRSSRFTRRLKSQYGVMNSGWDYLDAFFISEYSYSVYDTARLKAVVKTRYVDWIIQGGSPLEYEHCVCALEAHRTNKFYMPIGFDMDQSFTQICAGLTGEELSMMNSGLLKDKDGTNRNAWAAQDECMIKYDSNNILLSLGLDFNGRKSMKKGTTTVTGYSARELTQIRAFLGLADDCSFTIKQVDDGEVDWATFQEALSDRGRRFVQLLADHDWKLSSAQVVTHASDVANAISLSIATATPCSFVVQGAMEAASEFAREANNLRHWTDCHGADCCIREYRLMDKDAEGKNVASAVAELCFPRNEADTEWVRETWDENLGRWIFHGIRKELNVLKSAYNDSDLSLMPCVIQNTESAWARNIYYTVASMNLDVFLATTHDCVWIDAAEAPVLVPVIDKCFVRTLRDTNLDSMFAHMSILPTVTVNTHDGPQSFALVNPDRDQLLDRMASEMDLFGIETEVRNFYNK
jgi:hypothetical protein